MVTQQAGTVTSSGSGVLLSGTVPPLADAYYPREQSGPDLASSMRPGETVVLIHGEETAQAPAAQGGTGKTQLAVDFTHAMWNTRAVEILIWVNAASRESVITGFAQAANTVDASQPDEGAETAAARFVSWLAHTRRPWALVIDDLAELSDLEELWPSGASGRVLITTRLPADGFEAAAAEGGATEGMDLRVVPVPGLNRREALDYVTSRLTDYPDQRIEALDLGEDLDGLPLALAQATAAMSARRQGCREYRALLAERMRHMPAVPGVSAAVLATWSIAAECAHELPPAGLAWPTLVLAAMLDYHGVPGAVLTSPAACGYIAGRPSTANAADQNMVRAAINNLAQAGLVTIDPVSAVRTVQMHASVQAAVRAYLPAADLEQVVLAAADALLETWPDGDARAQGRGGQGQLGQPLPGSARAGPARLRRDAADLRRRPAVEAGGSPAAVPRRAVARAQQAVRGGHHVLEVHGGHQHPAARLRPRQRRGGQGQAGRGLRGGREVGRRHRGVPDRADRAGAAPGSRAPRDHRGPGPPGPRLPVGRAARRRHLACTSARWPIPRGCSARPTRSPWTPGPAWPRRTRRRAARGRRSRRTRRCSPTPNTTSASATPPRWAPGPASAPPTRPAGGPRTPSRSTSGPWPTRSGCTDPDHPDTIAARASLASAYRAAGKQKDAIAQYERVLADRERTAGADHPDTIAARANLAFAFRSAGRLREAVPLYERTLADRMRVQGADHRDTLTARSNLAACYQQARTADRRHPAVRAGAGRQRADARARGHGDADHPLQPGHRLLHGRTARPMWSRSCSGPSPTASVT